MKLLLLLILLLFGCGEKKPDDEEEKEDILAPLDLWDIKRGDKEYMRAVREHDLRIVSDKCGKAKMELIGFRLWAAMPNKSSEGPLAESERLYELKDEVEEECENQECEFDKETGEKQVEGHIRQIREWQATDPDGWKSEIKNYKRYANNWHRIACLDGRFPFPIEEEDR